jgi:elongation factor G
MVDLKVRLIDGKAHSVDSSDAAFQVAGFRALRAAAEAAHPVLLEPVMRLEISVPGAVLGDVIGDLNGRRGKILGTDLGDDKAVITAYVPLAETLDYEPKLSSMTHGKGAFSMALDHHDLCPPPAQERVVKESALHDHHRSYVDSA